MASPLESEAQRLQSVASKDKPPFAEAERLKFMVMSEGKFNVPALEHEVDIIKKAIDVLGTGSNPLSQSERKEKEEQQSDALTYTDLLRLRTRYEMLERQRLIYSLPEAESNGTITRSDGTKVKVSRTEALKSIEELDDRIRLEFYQQHWVSLILEEVRLYEEHRTKFPSARIVPRDKKLEAEVKKQLIDLQRLLEQAVLLGRIRQLKAEKKSDVELRPLLEQLPQGTDVMVYGTTLATQINAILAQTVGLPTKKEGIMDLWAEKGEIQAPLVFRLRTDLFERHFNALLTLPRSLKGKTDDISNKEKEAYWKEQKNLLEEYFRYHALHLEKYRELYHLLIEPGSIYAQESKPGKPDLDYGPLSPANIDYLNKQREQQMEGLIPYLDHMEQGVLGDKILDLNKLFEEYFMTVVAPRSFENLFDKAKDTTQLWGWYDKTPTGWIKPLRPWRTRAVMEPIYKQFGLPANYNELPREEQERLLQDSRVQEKMESVRKIVREFRGTIMPELEQMRGANACLKDLLMTGKTKQERDGRVVEGPLMRQQLEGRGKLPWQLMASGNEPLAMPPEGWPGKKNSQDVFNDIMNADTAVARGMYYILIEAALDGSGNFQKGYESYIKRMAENLQMHVDSEDLYKQIADAWLRESAWAIYAMLGEVAMSYVLIKSHRLIWRSGKGAVRLGSGGLRAAGRGASSLGRKVMGSGSAAAEGLKEASAANPRQPLNPQEFEQHLDEVLRGIEEPSAPRAPAIPESAPKIPEVPKTAEALAKEKYLAREAKLAETLEKSAAGKGVSALRSVGNARIVRGGLKVLKYGTTALIPAITAVEAYQTHERVASAEGSAGLQSVYREGYTTTALESAGLAATIPLSFGPQIVLMAPVMWAGSYRSGRAEVRAGWEREPQDWAREFDSTGLITQLRDTTLSSAVDAGGGGALKSRIMLPSKKDQLEAADTLEQSQRAARGKILEAYFGRNLLVPQGTSADVQQRLISWKKDYMRMVTGGSYNDTYSYLFRGADTYAELMERKERMEKNGEPLLLSYFDEKDERKWIDLSKLGKGSANQETMRIVNEYENFIRPAEEVFYFNALGIDPQKKVDAERTVKRIIMSKFMHHIHRGDSDIASLGEKEPQKNILRSYVAARMQERVDALIPRLLNGEVNPEEYHKILQECEGYFQRLDSIDISTAGKFFEGKGFSQSRLSEPGRNPLDGLLEDALQPDEAIHNKGSALLRRIGGNFHKDYITKQYGWIGNKFLYVQFDQEKGKWLAGLKSQNDAINDPAVYQVNMWGGSDKYNQLLADLAAVNEGKEPSQ